MRDKGKNQKNLYFMSFTNVLERCLLLHIYMLIFISLLSTENHKKTEIETTFITKYQKYMQIS